MERVNCKGSRRVLLLTILFICGLFLIGWSFAENVPETERPPIHMPITEADENSPTGLRTIWSCIYFGAYPSSEIVDASWNAVDEYALQSGDMLRDDALYAELSSAEWENDRTELNGVSYVRVGLDQAPAEVAREQHYLYELEKRDKLQGIVTQNIDGLHKAAGNIRVYELHGSVHENYCMECNASYPMEAILHSTGIPRCECGGVIKPKVVLYGEPLPKYVCIGARQKRGGNC